MASILMVAGEGLPFIKTGGLADVIGSLPKALTERGHEVKVVMPLYKKISDKYYNELHFDCEYSVSINYHEVPVRVFSKMVDNVCFFYHTRNHTCMPIVAMNNVRPVVQLIQHFNNSFLEISKTLTIILITV